MAGTEYSAIVAKVCTANVAASGHNGIDRSSLPRGVAAQAAVPWMEAISLRFLRESMG